MVNNAVAGKLPRNREEDVTRQTHESHNLCFSEVTTKSSTVRSHHHHQHRQICSTWNYFSPGGENPANWFPRGTIAETEASFDSIALCLPTPPSTSLPFAYEAAHADTDATQTTCSNFIAMKCRENKEKGETKERVFHRYETFHVQTRRQSSGAEKNVKSCSEGSVCQCRDSGFPDNRVAAKQPWQNILSAEKHLLLLVSILWESVRPRQPPPLNTAAVSGSHRWSETRFTLPPSQGRQEKHQPVVWVCLDGYSVL